MIAALRSIDSEGWSAIRARAAAVAVGMVFVLVTFRASLVAMGAAPEPRREMTAAVKAERRAEIVDRKGELLAASLTFDSLAANPRAMWDASDVVDGLMTVFPEMNRGRLETQLSDTRREFVWLRRKVSPRERQAVYGLGLEGLEFRREVQRIYPAGSFAGHLIGYANIDLRGISGLEYAYNARLADGGEPLRLTIDSGVQYALEDELNFAAEAFNIKGAAGVVIEARTGAVRGVASWPELDPNRPGDSDDTARLNRAVGAVYELGSVFKPLTVAAALDAGVLRPSDVFDVSKPLHLGAMTVKDDHPIDDTASVTDVIAHSSNIGTVKINDLVGVRRQKSFLGDLGLLSRPDLNFPGAARPLLPEDWSATASATISYGHGLAVSPLALAHAYTAFANNGEIAPLKLVEPDPFEEITPVRVMSAPTAKLVTQMMRATVTEGTGQRADVYGYQVAGKTGTAEKPIPGGYAIDRNVTTFAAVFPASRPEYVVLITLDEPLARPGEGRSAAFNAAPVAGRLIARIAPMLGVTPVFDDETVVDGQDEESFRGDVRSVSQRREL